MLIYYLVIGGLFITALIDHIRPFRASQKYWIFYAWVVIIILFKGLRWDLGTDWGQYQATFYRANWSNIFSYWRYGKGTTLMEFGYMFLNTLIRTFFRHYTFFLLITNAAIFGVFAKAIYKNIPRFQLTALAILLVSVELFPVRQTLTFAVLCYASKYILNRDFKRFCLCVLINFTIHRSSVIYFPFYFLLAPQFNYMKALIIYSGCAVGSVVLYRAFELFNSIPILILLTGGITQTYDATNERFQETQEELTLATLAIAMANVICQLTVFAYAYHKMKKKPEFEPYLNKFNFVLNVYLALICMNTIAMNPGFGSLNRMTNGLWTAYPFCIGYTCLVLKRYKWITLALFLFAFAIKYSKLAINYPKSDAYEYFVPYKSFLQQDEPQRDKWEF